MQYIYLLSIFKMSIVLKTKTNTKVGKTTMSKLIKLLLTIKLLTIKFTSKRFEAKRKYKK